MSADKYASIFSQQMEAITFEYNLHELLGCILQTTCENVLSFRQLLRKYPHFLLN